MLRKNILLNPKFFRANFSADNSQQSLLCEAKSFDAGRPQVLEGVVKDLARVEVEDDDLVQGSMRLVIRQALLHCHSSVTDLSFQREVDTLDKNKNKYKVFVWK